MKDLDRDGAMAITLLVAVGSICVMGCGLASKIAEKIRKLFEKEPTI